MTMEKALISVSILHIEGNTFHSYLSLPQKYTLVVSQLLNKRRFSLGKASITSRHHKSQFAYGLEVKLVHIQKQVRNSCSSFTHSVNILSVHHVLGTVRDIEEYTVD